jgi:hypothetical protein
MPPFLGVCATAGDAMAAEAANTNAMFAKRLIVRFLHFVSF